jgi:hypothetical protein
VVQPPENGVLFRQYERTSHLKRPGWAVSPWASIAGLARRSRGNGARNGFWQEGFQTMFDLAGSNKTDCWHSYLTHLGDPAYCFSANLVG